MAVNTSPAGQPVTEGQNWYARSPDEVAAVLDVNPAVGLPTARAAELLGTTDINLRQFGWALVPAVALLALWEFGKLIARRSASHVRNFPAIK